MAQRKVLSLIEAGAAVTVISPVLTPKLAALKKRGSIEHIPRYYEDGDLKGAFLTISAAGAAGLNDRIIADGSLLNAADEPDKCDFIVPSTVTRGQLTIAVSTSGISPALSRTIAAQLRENFSRDFSSYLSFLKKFRTKAIASNKPEKADLLKMAGDSDSIAAVKEGRLKELKAELSKRLAELLK
ncbi:MAG: bifunctional precorrin-2 dehydrogenase/sirohydrochlorin ferrochelatase [Nitrospirota bacterium]